MICVVLRPWIWALHGLRVLELYYNLCACDVYLYNIYIYSHGQKLGYMAIPTMDRELSWTPQGTLSRWMTMTHVFTHATWPQLIYCSLHHHRCGKRIRKMNEHDLLSWWIFHIKLFVLVVGPQPISRSCTRQEEMAAGAQQAAAGYGTSTSKPPGVGFAREALWSMSTAPKESVTNRNPTFYWHSSQKMAQPSLFRAVNDYDYDVLWSH